MDNKEPSLENKTVESIPAVTIRFAGDSGDGMQLVGTRFTDTSALFGNDLATLPSFPAEIRAPQGTIAGVSSFQVQIADFDILTPGDNPDVLVAMNPAALKAHLDDLAPNGMLEHFTRDLVLVDIVSLYPVSMFYKVLMIKIS